MLYLLSLEWKKWRKSLIFRLLLGAYIILLPSLLLLGKKLPDLPDPIGSTDVLYYFPTVWEYLGYIGNWLSFFFLGFFAVVLITTEYSNRTIRQNIIDGLSRRQFVSAKLLSVATLALAATLYYVSTALVIGLAHTEVVLWEKVFQNWTHIPRYFLMCAGYMTFGLLVGFVVKRTGLALFLYLGYIMVGETVLRWGVHRYFYPHPSMHYYPMNAVEDLVPVPFTDAADEFLREYGFSLFLQPQEAVLITAIYLSLFAGLIYWLVQRSNL